MYIHVHVHCVGIPVIHGRQTLKYIDSVIVKEEHVDNTNWSGFRWVHVHVHVCRSEDKIQKK